MTLFLSNFSGCGDTAVTAAWKHSSIPTSERGARTAAAEHKARSSPGTGNTPGMGWEAAQPQQVERTSQSSVAQQESPDKTELLLAPSTGQRCKTEILLSRKSLTPTLKEAQGLGKWKDVGILSVVEVVKGLSFLVIKQLPQRILGEKGSPSRVRYCQWEWEVEVDTALLRSVTRDRFSSWG